MNPLLFQALCGAAGILAGLLLMTAGWLVEYLCDPVARADRKWCAKNAKAWKEYERVHGKI